MKNLLVFLKLTAQGGLLVLMPFLLFILLLKEMVELVLGLATPIAKLFPVDTFQDLKYPEILAVILIAKFVLADQFAFAPGVKPLADGVTLPPYE